MPRPGTAKGLGGTPSEENQEFGTGDQEFGGGADEIEYGELEPGVGQEGVVGEGNVAPKPAAPDEEERSRALLPDDEAARDEAEDRGYEGEEEKEDGRLRRP